MMQQFDTSSSSSSSYYLSVGLNIRWIIQIESYELGWGNLDQSAGVRYGKKNLAKRNSIVLDQADFSSVLSQNGMQMINLILVEN